MALSLKKKPNLKEVVARNLREARKAKGLTQRALAEQVGVEEQYISNLETQSRNLSLETLERLAKKLGVASADLLREATPSPDLRALDKALALGVDAAIATLRELKSRIEK